VVDRRFVLGTDEKEKFRTLMRMQENFTGCRVLSYCLMDNHFHLLLEVPPMAEGGISDEALLKRLSAIYGEAFVTGVAQELADARSAAYTSESGLNEAVAATAATVTKNTAELLESKDNETALKDLGTAKMLRCRIRYFTAGAVIGIREFVNEAFSSARSRFGPKRKDGARKLKGNAALAGDALWSLRDLRKGVA
jgi:REP element-mobilizing transposase RayT